MKFWFLLFGILMLAPIAQAKEMIMRVSWYQDGVRTADGTRFNPDNPTIAAHRTFPFGTVLLVQNLENGREMRMVVHDRGPYKKGVDLDVSRRAAEKLGFKSQGVADMRVMIGIP